MTNLSELVVFDNLTEKDSLLDRSPIRDGDTVSRVFLGLLLSAVSLTTCVGNSMVLHAVRTEKRLQTVCNMFIVSLAVADLTVGTFVMPISAVYVLSDSWRFGRALCQVWLAVDYTASTASILNLLILSLDRYWSVSDPLLYLHKRTKTRARVMICFVWVTSALWIIPIFGWHNFANGGVYTIPEGQCDPEYKENFPLKIVTGLLNFYIPLSVMYVLYGRIFNEIRKRTHLEEKFHSAYQLSGGASGSVPVADGKSGNPQAAAGSSNCPGSESASSVRTDDRGGASIAGGSRPPGARTAAPAARCHTEYVYDESILEAQTERVRPLLVRASCTNLRYTCSRCFPPDPPQQQPPPPPPLLSIDSIVRESVVKETVAMELKTTNNGASQFGSSFKRSSSLKKDIKAVRQLGVIMGAFTACFLPYFVIFVVVAFCHDCISADLMLALTWVGYANSTLNPALYPLCNQTFRRKFRSMLRLVEDRGGQPVSVAGRRADLRLSKAKLAR